MGEERVRIGSGDGRERCPDRGDDGLPGAGADPAQRLLGLGEGLLDGIEVRE